MNISTLLETTVRKQFPCCYFNVFRLDLEWHECQLNDDWIPVRNKHITQKMKCGNRQQTASLDKVNARNGKCSCHKSRHRLTFKLNFYSRIGVQWSVFGVNNWKSDWKQCREKNIKELEQKAIGNGYSMPKWKSMRNYWKQWNRFPCNIQLSHTWCAASSSTFSSDVALLAVFILHITKLECQKKKKQMKIIYWIRCRV